MSLGEMSTYRAMEGQLGQESPWPVRASSYKTGYRDIMNRSGMTVDALNRFVDD